jgi:hypothetical protein
VAWNGSIFVTVNNVTSTSVYTNTDVNGYTARTVTNGAYLANHWDSFRNLFVIAGSTTISTSANGTAWTQRSTVVANMRGGDSNSTRSVIVGDSGKFYHSTDDITWTVGDMPTSSRYFDVAAKV